MSKHVTDRCWLTTHILYGMEKLCHLSIDEIGLIIQKTPLIDFLIDNYNTLHQEGMVANIQGIQAFLKRYDINISIDYSLVGKKEIPS